MRFIKMHGLGNDYVYVDCFHEKTPEDPAALAVRLSRRHFSIGSDGLILIEPTENADAAMRVFNADGSEAEMCGNGLRCVAKYVRDSGIRRADELRIETKSGVKSLRMIVENGVAVGARADMGEPKIDFVDKEVEAAGETLRLTAVTVGNPHAVAFVSAPPEDGWFYRMGPAIERHPLFPERINVEFVEGVSRGELRARVWERGSGETLACGSGACACLVAASVNGLAGRKVRLLLAGGELDIEWSEADGHVYMEGPAEIAFVGEVRV